MAKKLHIVVFPEGLDEVKRYSIPRNLPRFAFLFFSVAFIALAAFAAHTWLQLQEVQNHETEVVQLREKAVKQNLQILAFSDKVKRLERQMAKLEQFERKLRAMTGRFPAVAQESDQGRGGGEAGISTPQQVLKQNTASLVRQMHRDLDRLLAEASVHERDQNYLAKFLEDTKALTAATPSDWPLKGRITSRFGYRSSPFSGSSEFHRGLDIAAPNGTPILCPADGVVVDVEWHSGYGRILSINHGYGLVTRYAHLHAASVKPGDTVQRGQKIAEVGSSGRVTGPHLHYECILNGIPVNPMRYLVADRQ